MDGLEIRIRNRSYSVELKLQAVQDYLSGQYSQYEVIDTYKITSRTQLKSWINKYNSHSSSKSDIPMEAFWGTLKCEMYYLQSYNTFEELKRDIEAYIHFYNNERLQAKLNDLSPVEFRAKAV
ncbi:IS3 family transposase [Paenibacillus sp. FSL H8-0034]|uniref:IS3 family transposase n=1 Tax=Paenibacillus sp. FSL H8-0034 TaxID=2954671 RepID=UPI0030F79304